MNEKFLQMMKDTGIAIAFDLIQKERLTNLEEHALEAVSHFAHGVAAGSAQDRIVHAMVAMESLLLRNENEPILGKLGQRVALLTKRTLQERRQAIHELNDGYRLRSAFVHHGLMPEDVDAANRLLFLSWEVVNAILSATRTFKTKDLTLSRIDDELLSP